MNRQVIQYLFVQYRRTARLALRMLIAGLAVSIIMCIGVWLVKLVLEPDLIQPVQVAVVTGADDDLDMLVQVFHEMESVRGVCDMVPVSEPEARIGVDTGKYDVAVILDDDFYERLDAYENGDVTFLLSDHGAYQTTMFRELLLNGVSLIRTVEAAMLSTDQVIREDGALLKIPDAEQLFLDSLIEQAFLSGKNFQKIGVTDKAGYTMFQYYGASIWVVLLLTGGLCFGSFYSKDHQLVEQMLKRKGVGCMHLGICKVLPMATFLYVCGLIQFGLWNLIGYFFRQDPLYISRISFVSMGLIAFSVAAFFHMIYSWTGYHHSSGMILALCMLILVILSGCLIPTVYFPDSLYRIGQVLPVNVWHHALLVSVVGDPIQMKLVKVAGIGAVCFAIAEVGMWKNM